MQTSKVQGATGAIVTSPAHWNLKYKIKRTKNADRQFTKINDNTCSRRVLSENSTESSVSWHKVGICTGAGRYRSTSKGVEEWQSLCERLAAEDQLLATFNTDSTSLLRSCTSGCTAHSTRVCTAALQTVIISLSICFQRKGMFSVQLPGGCTAFHT